MKKTIYLLLIVLSSCIQNRTHIEDKLPEGIINSIRMTSGDDYNFVIVMSTKNGYETVYFKEENKDMYNILNTGDTIINSDRIDKFDLFDNYKNGKKRNVLDSVFNKESKTFMLKKKYF